MESLTIVGGIPSPFLSSSLRTPSSRITNFSCSLIIPNAVVPNHHLAALQPAFHLFSSAPKRHHRPRIFLPHLVASMEEVEQTYIIIKPDGVQRGLPYLLGKLQDILQEGLSSFQSQTFGQSSKGLRISTYGFRIIDYSARIIDYLEFFRKNWKFQRAKIIDYPKKIIDYPSFSAKFEIPEGPDNRLSGSDNRLSCHKLQKRFVFWLFNEDIM